MREAGQASLASPALFSRPLPCFSTPPHSQLGFLCLLSRNPLREGNTEWRAWASCVICHSNTGNLQETKKEDKGIYCIGKYLQGPKAPVF